MGTVTFMDETAGVEDPIQNAFHVYPRFGREHVTSGAGSCWCDPEIEDVPPYGRLIIHQPDH